MSIDPPSRVSALLPGELDWPNVRAPRSKRVSEAVAVATRILEDEGAGALTMRRLAGEMGIKAASLYKHFASKSELELLLVEDALFDVGEISHRSIQHPGDNTMVVSLLSTYRAHSLSNPNLYRLATSGPLDRHRLPDGLEEWAGNPWFVVTGDAFVAQALWSFAHGMVLLELDKRFPPDSNLDATWRAGATAFERSVT